MTFQDFREADMKSLIEQLNHQFKHYRFDWGIPPVEALGIVADSFGLVLVEDDGEQCCIYQAAAGLVNCWIGPPEEDGYGFDDQTAWYSGDLIVQE